MDSCDVEQVVAELVGLDPAVADRAELDRIVALNARLRSWSDRVDVAVARRIRELSSAAAAGVGTTGEITDVVCGHGRRDRRDARAVADRAEVCDRMAGFDDALATGAISAGHLDAVARATRGLDEHARSALAGFADDLLATATSTPVAEFERTCRDLVTFLTHDDGADRLRRQKADRRLSRWIDRDTGMWKLHAELDPEAGAKVWTALDAHLATVTQRDGNRAVPLERLAADALTELVTGSRSVDRRVPEVCVHVDAATLAQGWHADTVCELVGGTPLPVDTVRRWCCDAVVVPIVVAPGGDPIDAGRAIRTANRTQRRLLRAMHRTCAHPDCDVPFEQCEIHHVIEWTRLGVTDLANLVPLCAAHHHLFHEARWTMAITPERVITITRPDGTTWFEGDTRDRPPHRPTRRPTHSPPHRRTATAA